MVSVDFELKPFELESIESESVELGERSQQTANLSIKGKVSRKKDKLSIRYHLSGNLGQIAIPPIEAGGSRQDRLWEKTCFEFFLMPALAKKKEDMSDYWEFNLSPNGDWNVFALSGYRQGLKEETAFSRLPFEAWKGFQGLQLEAVIDLNKLVKQGQKILLNVSAVVVMQDGRETFWAIAHPDSQADFHHPESFTLAL